MTAAPTLLLVHGAWHGAWSWRPLLEQPALAGFQKLAVDLPGKDRAPGQQDLEGHSRFLRDRVAVIDGPIIAVSHSYGGAVVGDALHDLDIAAYVFVASFNLEVGESCRDANPHSDTLPYRAELRGDYLIIPPEVGRPMFFGDAGPAAGAAAAARLTPEHIRTVTMPVRHAAWRQAPSTYVVTEHDAAIPVEDQEAMAARTTYTVRMASDHSPMLSRPRELAEIIDASAARALARSDGRARDARR